MESSQDPLQIEIGIVGAGLAGLCCARRLAELGIPSVLFEAADRVGGRVATDELDGYLLDRGFQVLLSSYPEARGVLDLERLELGAFVPGSLVRASGRFARIVDPWRAPLGALATLRAPFVELADAARMARLRHDALRGGARTTSSTADAFLRERGFSESMREAFFRPFFAGVTLDPELSVPADWFLALFGWFATGSATLPARGMQAIPEQLAAGLPEGSVRLGAPVAAVTPDSLSLESGARVTCRHVVVACDGSTAARLLGRSPAPGWLGTTTIYYGCERPPFDEAILVLDGDGPRGGPVNHLCVPSNAQPSYAPPGRALVAASVLGVPENDDGELDRAVRAQLAGWYGNVVSEWHLLRVDRIPHALPRIESQGPGAIEHEGIFVCGDHLATPSIQGTMLSGRQAAEAVAASMR